MKPNTKAFIVSHVVVFMMGVAIAAALFYREDPLAEEDDPMFTYDESDEGCGCGDSVDTDVLLDSDTTWIQYKPTDR